MPSSAVSSIIRAATKEKDAPFNILTFVTHERYENFLCKTGHNFYALSSVGAKEWNTNYGPVPDNYHILKSPDETIRIPLHLDVDFLLSQSKFGQFQIAKQIATRLQLPLISLEHTLPVDDWSPDNLRTMRSMRGDINVYITEYNLKQWEGGGADSCVIYHGLDTVQFSPPDQKERVPHALSVVNDWVNRDYCCGFNIWKQIADKIPVKVVGDTPGLSESAKSVEELVEIYRSSQVFLNTSTLSPIPMSLMEAMSCGCAVVSTNNCAIPELIQDGENGFLFDYPEQAVEKINLLLSDTSLARKMGENARKTITTKFSQDAFVDRWNTVFSRASNMIYTGVN
jgi:glycosyltransferase involved in cell wall biosynthesis